MVALAARIQHRRDTEKINMAPGQDDMQICEAFHILKNNQKLRNTFAQLRKPSTKQKGMGEKKKGIKHSLITYLIRG